MPFDNPPREPMRDKAADEAANLLRKTRGLIEMPGAWTTATDERRYASGRVAYCLRGALSVAAYGSSRELASRMMFGDRPADRSVRLAVRSLASSLPAARFSDLYSCVEFNDASGTTHGRILALIDAAIAAVESGAVTLMDDAARPIPAWLPYNAVLHKLFYSSVTAPVGFAAIKTSATLTLVDS